MGALLALLVLGAWPAIEPCPEPVPEGMACVPGGPFLRGVDRGPKNARPEATVFVQTFLMDVHEVTSAEYRACMKRGACPPAKPKYVDFSRDRQPMVGVSWHDAVAYCAVGGKRLPTEAEWEKAARGPSGERYPWGNERATCDRAIIKGKKGRGCGKRKRGQQPEKGRTWEIGSRPAGRYGLFDMAGNSWEWVADWYSKSWAECGEACAGADPRGPCGGRARCPGHRYKVVRGGSWYWPARQATGFWRRPHVPSNRPYHHFGFRCASDARGPRATAPR